MRTFCLLCILLGLTSSGLKAQSTNAPNVLFILVDDLGWKDLGCYGSEFYETPRIDQFAQSAMRFTQAYTASPVCSPTRAANMSGKHPARIRITDWIPGHDPQDRKLLGPTDLHQLPLSEQTLAEAFQAQGYTTFFAGKWHLGDRGYLPEDQGFDINKGGHHKGSPPGGYYVPYNNPMLADGPEGEYLTDRLTEETLDFITQHKDKPFFAFLSFYNVHTPIEANQRHVDYFQAKANGLVDYDPDHLMEDEGFTKLYQNNPAYASMIRAVDENVGRLWDHLKELGLQDETVIVFTSDNGGLSTLYRRNAPTANVPLRAGKGWCYEGGIRIPLIIRAPDITQAGTSSDVPVISMDFFPTLLALAGIPLLPAQHVDGIDLTQVLKGKGKLLRKTLYWHFPHYHGSAWTPGSAIRIGDWKLIEFYDREKVELYHIGKDVGESIDLSAKKPGKVRTLRKKLQQQLAQVDAQFPIPNPDPADN